MSNKIKKDTQLVKAGREKAYTGSAVNPRIVRASTVTFETVEDMQRAGREKDNGVPYYGRRGTSTTFALQKAMCELEGAAGSYVYSCGTAAITSSLLAFLSTGDHVLIVDSVYEPTRNFAMGTLARMGVEVGFYDPMLGGKIADLVQVNTKVIFLESPGSLTMEVQDVPAIVKVAKAHDIVTMIDNTFATPLHFKPLDFGVDISIHSATKYINGHSDVMLGVASANSRTWETLRDRSYELGQCASVDDIYTTLRGLRTLSLRMLKHEQNALEIAYWLDARAEVDHLRHPSFESCPGNEYYRRDFSGGNGLFSFVLNRGTKEAVNTFLDGMQHFKMGFSWGGYESLILAPSNISGRRTATQWQAAGPLIRLHIGLEDLEDLIDDLRAGFERFNKVMQSATDKKKDIHSPVSGAN